jgi:uncharacterized protein
MNATSAMDTAVTARYSAFAGSRRIGSGSLTDVALAAKAAIDAGEQAPILIFDDDTSRIIDVDLRGTTDKVAARLTASAGTPTPTDGGERTDEGSPYREGTVPRGRGRPKLGVVAREVTLLPRHWDWLATQPGGASAAVRRLVDSARQANAEKDRVRAAKESAYRFMAAMAGDEPGFEEATRALFADNPEQFAAMTERWPRDVRDHARALAARARA